MDPNECANALLSSCGTGVPMVESHRLNMFELRVQLRPVEPVEIPAVFFCLLLNEHITWTQRQQTGKAIPFISEEVQRYNAEPHLTLEAHFLAPEIRTNELQYEAAGLHASSTFASCISHKTPSTSGPFNHSTKDG